MSRTRGYYLGGKWGPWVMRYPVSAANVRRARAGMRLEVNAFGQVDLSGHLGRHGLHLGYTPRRKFTWRDAAARRRLQAVQRLQDAERAVVDATSKQESTAALALLADARVDNARVTAEIARREAELLQPRVLRVYPRRLAPGAA